MTDPLKRYEFFGWDYAKYSPLSEAEVGWYLSRALETGGPVLGLACGTARLLCKFAEAGFETTGIDLSQTMLAIARRNVEALAPEARERVTLVRGDMSAFDLGRSFGQIHVADNSLRELATREVMLACLRCVRAHLKPREGGGSEPRRPTHDASRGSDPPRPYPAPGGRFLMAERRFDPALYPNGRREFGWSEPVANPLTGDTFRRRGRVDLSPDAKSLRGEFIYEVIRPDGSFAVERCPFNSLILRTHDYLALLAEAGFESEAFADYTDRRADGSEAITCFVCGARS